MLSLDGYVWIVYIRVAVKVRFPNATEQNPEIKYEQSFAEKIPSVTECGGAVSFEIKGYRTIMTKRKC